MSDLAESKPIVRPFMPELDTIRGIAILLVIVFHGFQGFEPSPNASIWERLFLAVVHFGWTGVNLFFVLSGFLITGILLDSTKRPNYYSRFYFRRAIRILPAYYLLIITLLFIARLSFVRWHMSLSFAGLSAIYLSNVAPLFGVAINYAPLWSLAVEEHFYLIWPAAVKRFTRKALVALIAIICTSELFLRVYCVAKGGLWWGPYTWLAADGLALGALLAIIARSKWGSRKTILRLAVMSALLAIAMFAVSVRTPNLLAISLRATGVNYVSLSCVSMVLWIGTGSYCRFVDVKLLSFYGFISYGLYLVHVLIFNLYDDISAEWLHFLSVGGLRKCLLRLLLVTAISTFTAYISRISYEEFFLKKKNNYR